MLVSLRPDSTARNRIVRPGGLPGTFKKVRDAQAELLLAFWLQSQQQQPEKLYFTIKNCFGVKFATPIGSVKLELSWTWATTHLCLRVHFLLLLPFRTGPKTAAPKPAQSSGQQDVAASSSTDLTHASYSHLPLELLCKLLPSNFFVPGGRLSQTGFLHHLFPLPPKTWLLAEGAILGKGLLCHFEFLFVPEVSARFQKLCNQYLLLLFFYLFLFGFQ